MPCISDRLLCVIRILLLIVATITCTSTSLNCASSLRLDALLPPI